jgi:glycosyltransferase involved in cell wall biosynthesis
MAGADRLTVALLPWGQVIEDFLDAIDVTLDGFLEDMSGGWLFGYVEALAAAGIGSVLVCPSASVSSPTRRVHMPTGAPVWLLPPTRAWRVARRRVADAGAWSVGEAVPPGVSAPGRLVATGAHHALPWLATPPLALRQALRAEGCRAVVCQEYEDARFDVALAVGRSCGVPVFATFQGGDRSRTPLERRSRARAVRAAAGLVVGSAPEAERVVAAYGVAPERIAAVPNPLDLREWPVGDRAAARAELGLAPDTGVVAWHGRVDRRRKGLDVLVEAWRCVTAARPGRDLVLLLCGTGPDAAALHEDLAAGPDGYGPVAGVRWHDEYVLDRTLIRRNLAAADAGVLPSRHEGFPVALVEMMASGRPVVAAAAPGVADILPGGPADGGDVVPVGDPEALAAALGRLLDEPGTAAERGRAARARVESTFSPAAVGQALAQALVPERAERADRRLTHDAHDLVRARKP